jgi:hypothetical protein
MSPQDGGVEDDPERAMAEKATVLADAIDAVVGPWLIGAVRRVAAAQRIEAGDDLLLEAEAMAERTRADVVPKVRALLATDIDEQATTPLALLRAAVGPATELLRAHGAVPADRDEFAVAAFPDDVYGLGPAAFEDVAPELRDPGLEWGAAKAFVHLRRRRAQGG